MRTLSKLLISGAIAVGAATSALAAVNFDPTSGTGFVGKGDVQIAFGWNNKALQDNANNVSFKYESVETYAVTIEFDTGNPDNPKSLNTHNITQQKSQGVSGAVNGNPREKNQFTGFNLLGWLGTPTVFGEPIPVVGDPCNQGNLGTCEVLSVDLVSSSGALSAGYNGLWVRLQ